MVLWLGELLNVFFEKRKQQQMNRAGPFLIYAFEFLVIFIREQTYVFCSVAEIKGRKVVALILQIHTYFLCIYH